METEGTAYSMADLGMEVVVTIRADGTASMAINGEQDDGFCSMQDGQLVVDTMTGTLQDGQLLLSEVGYLMTLSREKPALPAETVAPETGTTEPAILTEQKYVMTDADMNGYNMTAAQLGNYEYSILLHEDGKVTFVMAGADIPGLTWAYGKIPTEAGEVDGVIIDYYTQALNLVPTETGFDMDYFGSMLMHFAPEEPAQ